MLQAFLNIFKIPELRTKVLFTLGMLAVFRVGHWIPLPGINQEQMSDYLRTAQQEGGVLGDTLATLSIFSGGAFSHSTIFGLGVMPYISASIIFQLIMTVSPRLKKLQEEGPTGRQKIQEWQRYATILLCIIQGFGWLKFAEAQRMIYAQWAASPMWWIMAIAALTAGTVFLMWIGEQIDKYGIGNGVSMIIMAGIVAGMPSAVQAFISDFNPADPDKKGWLHLLTLLGGFALVVGGSVLLTVAQRRIPVQQAKHTRGRKVFGGQRSFLPLRLNHSGVMPIVFASSLMIFPSVLFSSIEKAILVKEGFWWGLVNWMSNQFGNGQFPYVACEVLMIFFFSYFWITVQFNPEELAKQLRDQGSFIPGLRPGPRTAEYLEAVMERITYVGAIFLAVIAVLPMVASKALNIPYSVTQFLGGTGLLIVVQVVLDFVQRVEANLVMRNYAGFLGGESGRGPRIQGRQPL